MINRDKMLKFTVNEGVVVLDPSVLLIKEFTDIIDYCGDDKDLRNRLLLYVFFCCDLTDNNPLKDIDYRLKEQQAERRAFGESGKKFKVKERKLIDEAMDAYNFLNEGSIERATMTYDRKIDQIRSLLDETEPTIDIIYEEDETTIKDYKSNEKILAGFAKQIIDLSGYKLKAMKTASEIENTGRVRGGKGSSMIERGVFRDDKKKLSKDGHKKED